MLTALVLVVSGLLLPVSAAPRANFTIRDPSSVYNNSIIKPLGGSASPPVAQVVHEWAALEYDWPCDWVRDYYAERGWFNASTNLLGGLDVYKNDLYVTVIRVSNTIPSGLNKVVQKNGRSVLQPYPSLRANEIGICASLQFPFATYTDPNTGWMYVIDVGRIGLIRNSPAPCPPKIVVLDLNRNGTVVRSHNFPESVVPRGTNILNDLVLDYVTKNASRVRYAYITDTGNAQIVVYDFQTNASWSFRHPSMETDEDKTVTINGVNYTMDVPVDGIAMDPDFEYVYYCPVGTKKLHQIPTFVLRNPAGNFSRYARFVGNKVSNADGMASGKRAIFYGAEALNALYRWDISKDLASQNVTEGNVTIATESLVAQDPEKFRWVDSMKVSADGYLCFTSNRVNEYVAGTMDFSGAKGTNFRINKVFVGDKPYLLKDGSDVGIVVG
ncbi:unnamed protein product [Lymnaea stagnalis]|uniref:Uncharacterized protein n=1 Tax=Lymnaea stagnalis TaxID=6523 RepID=A0AAV2I2K5_LYMST